MAVLTVIRQPAQVASFAPSQLLSPPPPVLRLTQNGLADLARLQLTNGSRRGGGRNRLRTALELGWAWLLGRLYSDDALWLWGAGQLRYSRKDD